MNSTDFGDASVGRRHGRGFVLALAGLLAVGGVAHAQQPVPAVGAAASAASAASAPAPRATAPTSPTTRLIEAARPAPDAGRGNVATPQVAVPLRRAPPDPVAVKPGRPAAPQGALDESAARCQAERASGLRTNCRKP